MTREELERYNALMEVGAFLEAERRFDLAYHIQREIDILIQPAIERLKAKGRERDEANLRYMIEHGMLNPEEEK